VHSLASGGKAPLIDPKSNCQHIPTQTHRQPVKKIIAKSLSQHDRKHVVPIPLSGIRVGELDMVYLTTNSDLLFIFKEIN
jgi:hypothetical protein